MPARVIAGILSLIAFAVAVLAGLAASNPAPAVFFKAVVAMVLFYFVGLIIGSIAHHAVTEEIESYKAAHPIKPAEHPEPPDANAEPVAGDTADRVGATGAPGERSARSQAA